MVKAYNRCFRILETDEIVQGGFFGDTPTKGLDLPRDVLEKIYYKNASRLYPGLAELIINDHKTPVLIGQENAAITDK